MFTEIIPAIDDEIKINNNLYKDRIVIELLLINPVMNIIINKINPTIAPFINPNFFIIDPETYPPANDDIIKEISDIYVINEAGKVLVFTTTKLLIKSITALITTEITVPMSTPLTVFLLIKFILDIIDFKKIPPII